MLSFTTSISLTLRSINLVQETYEVLALLGCVVGSAIFSGSEAAVLSISPDRARQLIEEGDARGRAMRFMSEKSNEILTTILIGNTLVNILAASITTLIVARNFEGDVVGISTLITTVIILLFGEIIPKTFSRVHSEKLAIFAIRVLQFFFYSLWPVTQGLTWIIEKMLGKNAQIRGRIITKDDIEYMVNKAEKEKTIDSKQIELLSSILDFPTIKVKDIMIARNKVIYIDSSASFDQTMRTMREHGHSRYPVCRRDFDHVLGFMHVKDLSFITPEEKRNFNIKKYLKSPFFVYEHMKIQAVFDHMNRKKLHLALVKDENGLVVGIVTLEDIIEQIVGEIQDEHDEEEFHLEDEEDFDLAKGVIVEGTMSLRDLYLEYDVKIPLNDNYSTLAGFILDMLGNNFPEEGQIIVWEGFSFELTRVEHQAIKEVRICDVDGEKHLFSKKDIEEAIDHVDEKKDREN